MVTHGPLAAGASIPRVMLTMVVALFSAVAVRAASPPDPLFASDELLTVSLEIDHRALERQTEDDDPKEQDAQLSWTSEAGEALTLAVKVRPRGKSRRQLCDFPPLRLNLPKGQVGDTIFAGQDKLKLVTHCAGLGKRSRYARAHLGLEYAAYRLLNRISDVSFLVRPLKITYVDQRSAREREHFAFVIEHKDRLAVRLGVSVAEVVSIPSSRLDPVVTQRVDLFQYLIGNTDYSLVAGEEGEGCCHNSVAFSQGDGYLPVPYDFDMSGLVNKPEAKPRARLGITSVRTRLYRGYCRDRQYLDAAIEQYVAARPELMAELERAAELFDLAKSSLMNATKFIDDFYTKTLLQPAQVERRLIGRCRG